MSSRLQLDTRNLSLGRRHLVNAYEVEAGIGAISGNTVWSMPKRLECEVLQKARYINTLSYLYLYLTNWIASISSWTLVLFKRFFMLIGILILVSSFANFLLISCSRLRSLPVVVEHTLHICMWCRCRIGVNNVIVFRWIYAVILRLNSRRCIGKPRCLVAGSSTSAGWICHGARTWGRTEVGFVERTTSWIIRLPRVHSTHAAH